MNIPVEGEPVEMLEYLKATLRQHAFGVAGGAVWGTGAVACLAAASGTTETPSDIATATSVSPGPVAIYAATLGAAIVAALWGAAAWKDFRTADSRVKALVALMFVLLAGGLGVIAMAPAYARSITP
jgi:glucose uptake protein